MGWGVGGLSEVGLGWGGGEGVFFFGGGGLGVGNENDGVVVAWWEIGLLSVKRYLEHWFTIQETSSPLQR